MEKHRPADEMIQELDNLLSRINAMEVIAKDEFQKSAAQVLRALVQGQMHSIREFAHVKKALDLLMLQLFEVQNKTRG